MKFYFKSLMKIFILMYLFACSVEPKPIDYGHDNCQFCDMTIMDNKHAAEVVTTKGKIYKFDAIECMIRYTDKTAQQEYAYQLISDYSNPGELINAEQSIYLVSKNLPSPMGAFLSGFSSEKEAKLAMEETGGMLYNWKQIKENIN
jgi:copper chaperone NosL